MKFLFIDETGTTKDPNFYGVCLVSIDSNHYSSVCDQFGIHMQKSGWSDKHEFKGKFLFSKKQGDPNITIDERLTLAERLLSLNLAGKNAKLRVIFAWGKHGEKSHCDLVRKALRKLLPLARNHRGGKHLCSVFADENSRVEPSVLRSSTVEALGERGYKLVEDVMSLQSKSYHVGLCYADLIGYLAGWVSLDDDIDKAQLGLFEEGQISRQDPEKVRKAKAMLTSVKRIQFLRC
ncbi:hypothetical protein [Nitrospira sp. Nam74]